MGSFLLQSWGAELSRQYYLVTRLLADEPSGSRHRLQIELRMQVSICYITPREHSRLTMPVQGIHAGKGFLTAFACVRTYVQVQRFVALAVVLTRETLFAPGPLALEWPLFVV